MQPRFFLVTVFPHPVSNLRVRGKAPDPNELYLQDG
jgi:hypothetical protein